MGTSGVVSARLVRWRLLALVVATTVAMVSSSAVAGAAAADEPASAGTSSTPASQKIFPIPVRQPVPVYPKKLQEAGVTGTVVLSFVVNIRGDVEKVEALESPHEGLSTAAIDAVKQWKYKPGMLDGHPVSVRLRQSLSFGINSVAKPASR